MKGEKVFKESIT